MSVTPFDMARSGSMSHCPSEFFDLCIQHDILAFGEFTLKSGRVSPYFFNAGRFCDGLLLGSLASHYATLIHRILSGRVGQHMLYGPAYKGIPLATACAIRLWDQFGLNIPYAFNRKEAKDHAEGGLIVGAKLSGKVIITDDVITAGTSIDESVEVIQSAGAEPVAVVIALDREEITGDLGLSAVQTVASLHGMPVYSIARLSDLVTYLDSQPEMAHLSGLIAQYQERYGVRTD